MIKLESISLYDLLPPNLHGEKEKALATAWDKEYRKVCQFALRASMVFGFVMELDEEMDLFKEQISEELKKINDRLTNKNINLEFKMHQRTHRIYVEMVDKTTKKVVKEIPSKKMLDMIGRIWDEMGIAVDKKG